jgi:amino acid transporter
MERLYGPQVASVFTFLILWTAFGSVFALLLGYSRIPYAAACDGYFFKVFGRLHPTKQFPHVSLLVLGAISIACSLLPLGVVIDVLITTRIVVQFIGQVFAVMLLRATRPDMPRPFRMWLYPIPALVALAGWLFLLLTSGWMLIALGAGTLVLGVVCFLAWSHRAGTWPFEARQTVGAGGV